MPRTPAPEPQLRRRLDRDRVLVAAEAVVDRDGWEELTMTALAAELGVKVPSLYNHVPNLEALRSELQIRTMRELGSSLRRVAMGKSDTRGLRALADAFRGFARTYPNRYDGATHAPHDPAGFFQASVDASEAVAAVIDSYDIAEEDILVLQLTTFSMLHGVVVLENSGFFRGVVDADRVYELAVHQVLQLLDDARPTTAKAG